MYVSLTITVLEGGGHAEMLLWIQKIVLTTRVHESVRPLRLSEVIEVRVKYKYVHIVVSLVALFLMWFMSSLWNIS